MQQLFAQCEGAGTKKITVGFDGFVDTIVRLASKTDAEGNFEAYFATIDEFGRHLVQQANKSCSIELDVVATRLGGNTPLLSMGAAALGMDVTCIGMLGKPMSAHDIDPVFRALPCRMYSYLPAGTSTAMEFQDGKVLLAPRVAIDNAPWELILEATGGKAADILNDSDVMAFVNWSEITFSHALWESAYENAIKTAPADKSKHILFDLCDCARKPDEQLAAVLRLIGKFSAHRTGILSLNENEALILGARACENQQTLPEIGERIREKFAIDEVVIHTTTKSVLCTQNGTTETPSIYVAQPKISTGAGDHFNAAYCYAAAIGLADAQRIDFCHLFVHSYVKSGVSPSLSDLKALAQTLA